MQFSIFDVPFKCTRDMFTWEKVKWSIFVYWTLLWKGGLLAVGVMIVSAAIVLAPGFLNSEALAQFNNSELDVKITMHAAYSLHYWYQHLFVPGIVLLCLLFVGFVLGAIYIQYYTLFKKNYQSFSRQFNTPEIGSLWALGFWKALIFVAIAGLLIKFVVDLVLAAFMVNEGIIRHTAWTLGLTLFHVCLQGGTWGFVPVSRQQPTITK